MFSQTPADLKQPLFQEEKEDASESEFSPIVDTNENQMPQLRRADYCIRAIACFYPEANRNLRVMAALTVVIEAITIPLAILFYIHPTASLKSSAAITVTEVVLSLNTLVMLNTFYRLGTDVMRHPYTAIDTSEPVLSDILTDIKPIIPVSTAIANDPP